jgi:hypothetical protein
MKLIPKSLLLTIISLLAIPAIAYGSFHYMHPADPDKVYTKHGKLKMEWSKFFEAERFTEYLAKDTVVDEEEMTAEILVMRSYNEPQSSLYDHERVVYSSVVLHQVINCRSRTVNILDMMIFSQPLTKGVLVKDLYDLDYEYGEARPGSIDEKKIHSICQFQS